MYRSGEEYELIAKVFGSVFDQLAALASESALGVVPSALSAAAVSATNLPRRAVVAIDGERRKRTAHRALPRLFLLLSAPPLSNTDAHFSLACSPSPVDPATLRGDPDHKHLRVDCAYLSQDCVRCAKMLRAGVSQTPQTTNPYHTVQLTYGGDMLWLSKLLGITGPNGRHFCTGCLIPESAVVKAQAHALFAFDRHRQCSGPDSFVQPSPRSLTQANADHARFAGAAGGGRLATAKDHNNQIHAPLIRSEFSGCIAPSPLHVTLGLTQRCFALYYDAARELDRPLLEARVRGVGSALDTLHDEEKNVAAALASDRDECEASHQQLEMVSKQAEDCADRMWWVRNEEKRLEAQFKAALKAVTDGEAKLQAIGAKITASLGPFCRSIEAGMWESAFHFSMLDTTGRPLPSHLSASDRGYRALSTWDHASGVSRRRVSGQRLPQAAV
jgi:hypothetical protein